MILNRVHFRSSRVVSVQDSAQAQHEALTEQLREFLETGHEINNVDVFVYTETENPNLHVQALKRPCLVVGVVWHPENRMVCSMNFYLINSRDNLTHHNRQEKRLIELGALGMKGSQTLKLLSKESLLRLGEKLTQVLRTRLWSIRVESAIASLPADALIESLYEHPGAQSPESETEFARHTSRLPGTARRVRTRGNGTLGKVAYSVGGGARDPVSVRTVRVPPKNMPK